MYHKIIKPSNKKYSTVVYLSSLDSLSLSLMRTWVSVRCVYMRESASLFISFKWLTFRWLNQPVTLRGPTSPRETPNTHYMMLYYGLLPRLTTEVVPQGLDTIKTSHKGVNTSLMGVQQHTMIIYIRISSEFINTLTLTLNYEGILSIHNHQHICLVIHRIIIIIES